MLYIHHTSCISPQKTFVDADVSELSLSSGNMLRALEPLYEGIPPGQLRRMGKAVRLGVGAALPLLKMNTELSGIILGTANGGMEDCIKFLNQIIDYEEGTLTPTNFVQSTTNAIASQIAFMSKNKGYNITHVHRGLSFENALQDAMMHSAEHPDASYLLGGVDEISDYNFNIDFLIGCYKKGDADNRILYDSVSEGTIAGEGAAMFIVNGLEKGSLVAVKGLATYHNIKEAELSTVFLEFLSENNLSPNDIDMYISGENGDSRYDKFYSQVELNLNPDTTIVRYKHASGEFPSASAFSLWLACYLSGDKIVPAHMLKRKGDRKEFKNILIYNCYQGVQHAFVLVSL
jgi:hypothetical protein